MTVCYCYNLRLSITAAEMRYSVIYYFTHSHCGIVLRKLDSRLGFESQSWRCLVIPEIGDRLWQGI